MCIGSCIITTLESLPIQPESFYFGKGAVIWNPEGSSDETISIRLPKQFCQLGCITLKPYSEVSYFFLIYMNGKVFKISMVYGHCFWQNLKCPPGALMTSWDDFNVHHPCGTGLPKGKSFPHPFSVCMHVHTALSCQPHFT